MLRNTSPAPEFTLLDADGQPRSLHALRNERPFLLAFFRFAECPTAQKDLLRYSDVFTRVISMGAGMAAVSADTPGALRVLRDKWEIPYPLLSDAGFRVSTQYGVYRSDETEEGPQPHGEPAVFLLDAGGNIAYSQIQTGPKAAAPPAELALVLFYMTQHGGRYI